uniref:BspA family leucine-rich repeat surface protein n=1 Tax=Palpitomonas bilix TaxID=652834 RepID=A0A7S3LVC7_9EUKA|mmetsp:Transcript_49746/g.127973  ORF Transcript_49746/g.127973 Transcript_49746/m.127973 type:complete len:395 (+) Transcript_49746:414-1598(+)|eukprot:CAMPEP_0113882954 /NCGR_PEP_ID=MMETSP0780_2-20120614/9285_1 /TAXON_ID=652834 /ORGANISM="Palpitomonas bilix" /LENGTH=394 /DNA_ID=CAMNT_0000870113 /DNA_START=162 /DNA_END=1346 /DNA_ORIENTATION=+ /assembly_acc=CAM_ASM_000599
MLEGSITSHGAIGNPSVFSLPFSNLEVPFRREIMFREAVTAYHKQLSQPTTYAGSLSGPFVPPSTEEERQGLSFLLDIQKRFDMKTWAYHFSEPEKRIGEFRKWMVRTFGQGPVRVREILHSHQRPLFLFLYRAVWYHMYDFEQWTLEGQEVFYKQHPFFDILKRDVAVQDLEKLPCAWTSHVDRRFVKSHKEAREAVEGLIGKRNFRPTSNGYMVYTLDWEFPEDFDFRELFHRATSSCCIIHDVSLWDVSRATNLSSMFYKSRVKCKGFALWDVSRVTSFSHMFASYFARTPIEEDLEEWDVSAARDMSFMFQSFFRRWTGLQAWDVSRVENFEGMFRNSGLSFTREDRNHLAGWTMLPTANRTAMFERWKGVASFSVKELERSLPEGAETG